MLPSREEMLKVLPRHRTVAELGVDEGGFTQNIFRYNQPFKLHLVDFWGGKRYNQNKRKGVERKFAQEIIDGKIEINLGLSTTIVDQFPEKYFD